MTLTCERLRNKSVVTASEEARKGVEQAVISTAIGYILLIVFFSFITWVVCTD